VLVAGERGIVTPEAVVLEFDVAGVGSRILARLLDVALLSIVSYALTMLAVAIAFAVPELAVVVWILLSALVLVGYPVICETFWRGRTVGKFALGLRVVTREGAPARFRHAALRALIGLAEIWVTLGGIAVTSAVATRWSQRMGDLAAGTVVVRDRPAQRRSLAVAFPPPPGWEAYTASLDVSAITDAQYGVIRSFLMRVAELSAGSRAVLAVRLANPTALRMRHQPPATLAPELFLACVASAYQVRHGGLMVPSWSGPGAGPPGPPVGGPPPGAWPAPPVGVPAGHWGAPSP
jgi:uncharacterized RDD family membrane protein YckC